MNNCYEEKWQALKEEINRRGADGEAVVAALKDYYSIFEDRIAEWLGSLYNAEIGGFHFSKSSRDNETVTTPAGTFPLLPDIESTFQAMSMLKDSLMIENYDELPYEMREKIKNYVCSLQDEQTGFIYHPHWRILMQDGFGKDPNADRIWRSRRGRDMMWANGMCERLGFSLPYPTAYERLNSDEEQKSNTKSLMPDYLLNREAFVAHLNSLDWENDSYYAGNMIAGQIKLIVAAGLADTLIEFLNEKQNKDTGFWGKQDGYAAINGFLKTTAAYTETKNLIPNADKAAISIFKCATTSEPVLTVCYQYNVWFSLLNIINCLKSAGGEEGKAEAEKISLTLLKNCPEAIRATKEKALAFKREDGSFSTYTHGSASHSQGMPVAIKDSREGDLNGSNICINGTVKRIFEVLGLSDFYIPLYSPDAFDKFLKAAKCKQLLANIQ